MGLPSLAMAANPSAPGQLKKLDESLRQSVEQGCVGTQSVIITVKPGYREALGNALTAHGDTVTGEFPALNAISAVVHCEDLPLLAEFAVTTAVSSNAKVGVMGLDLLSPAQAEVNAAQAALTAAKAVVNTATAASDSAQAAARKTQGDVAAAQKAVISAQKAVAAANKLIGLAKTAALLTANAQLTAAQTRLTAALAADAAADAVVDVASEALVKAQSDLLAAQNRLSEAQDVLAGTAKTIAARDREGQSAQKLKRRFFETLPTVSVDDVVPSNPATSLTNAFGAQPAGGTGVGVAVVDSGIESGVDFENRISAFYDFTQGDIRVTQPNDGFGHGTHVAGLIGSRYVGVASSVRLIGLKVLDAQGRGTTDNVIRAIEFAVANKTLLGIQVINLSLGHPIYESAATDPLVQAVEHAARAGIVVVASAGNFGINAQTGQSGYAGIVSPGNAPSAMTVGATRTFNTTTRDDDRVAPYSSRGPSWYDGFAKPDVVAPGDNLLSVAAVNSTLRIAQEARGNSGDYMRLSGTSMAAGVASGVVALVLQVNPALTPNTVKAVLEYSAIPVSDDTGNRYDPLTQGAGEIETTGAMAFAAAIQPSTAVGGSWLSSAITPSTKIGGQQYVWSQSIIWGGRRVAGAQLLSEQRPAWALSVVWGEGLGAEDDNIVWGNLFDDDNIVWGNSFDEGDNIVWGNNVVWGNTFDDDNIVWGNLFDNDNIVWGNNVVWGNLFDDDNIVWGNNVVWGNSMVGMCFDDDNIVWGNLFDDDNIVWGNLDDDNIVWGNLFDDDNIVWGNTLDDDNIVWGNTVDTANVISWSGGAVRENNGRGHKGVMNGGVN